MNRTAAVERATRETAVSVTLTVEGTGRTEVNTGIGFLDHLLDTLGRHSGFVLTIACKGDLRVDDHHNAEDCDLGLGEALDRALGQRRGIVRYGTAYETLDGSHERRVDQA